MNTQSIPPNNLQRIQEVAALMEGEFNVDWLAELTGLKAHQVLAELQSIVDQRILTSPQPGIYAFRAPAKREQWTTHMKPDAKASVHKRIAALLMEDLPDNDEKYERVAHHLIHIANDINGCRILCRAGDVHRRSFRTEQAFQCFHKALLDLDHQSGETADQLFVETAIKYSKISTARHDTTWVLALLNRAMKRAKRRHSGADSALLEMHIAKNEWLSANYDQALAHFEKGWALAKTIDDPHLADAMTAFSTFFLYWEGRFTEAVESYERVVTGVEQYPRSRFPLLGAITVGYSYAQVGNYAQGIGMLDSIRTHCLEKGDLYLASYAIGNIGEIMLKLGRLDEALVYMEMSLKLARETNNRWVWMILQIFLAYTFFQLGKKKRTALHLQKFLEYREEAQAMVLPYSYLLHLALAMEKGDLAPVSGLSLEVEIQRMQCSNNIYMKGIGARFAALKLEQENSPPGKVREAFETSIRYLEMAGNQMSLIRSRLETARYLRKIGDPGAGDKLTTQVSQSLASMDEKLVPDDLRHMVSRDGNSKKLLREILELGQELVKIRDYHELVQRIISTGNRVTGAERGAIFMSEKGNSGKEELRLKASRNLTSDHVANPSFVSSMKMIEMVAASGRGLIAGVESTDTEGYSSEGAIQSKICVPLCLHDQVVGVLYHDNRLLASAFREEDLDVLSYFSALAAIALDNARAYDQIRRWNIKLSREKQYYEEAHLSYLQFDEIVGHSPAINEVLSKIEQVANTETTVLITGETGVGKELVARAIQKHSSRAQQPFIGVQLSALPKDLMASELLGHEKGAFTGATHRQAGRLELADGGTLFLDEIGDISHDIQIRLLRVLQTRQFERVGGMKTLSSDFRLIAATNRELESLVRDGRFRADLYYRLNVFPIYVPPLRDRREDIPLLAMHFLKLHAAKLNKQVMRISDREMDMLKEYDWPGNVRELKNVVERGVILSTNRDFRMPELQSGDCPPLTVGDTATLAENERSHILRILKRTGWKVAGASGAAKILDIPPSTLSFRMNKLGIKRPG
ncbi:transcriptional regulator, NifA subfamily, Fis Family [Desulfatibacillum aliphaticivorans]|uniref:Transcriptional regulator, NifA subfamily, Fis Family n=1 Tax=Desulfatibacillum aliphaticivorans TaxID=218208 RepID=B8FLD5_DESAL|nr:sigma 54-interacting transcriptional regulator [Desulfatibacillum aliphaticivorans]ACL05081.1 transcriptional regulator, NifA subfamily, Fis Family [Desulfatibacillum aliphaticivorans]